MRGPGGNVHAVRETGGVAPTDDTDQTEPNGVPDPAGVTASPAPAHAPAQGRSEERL